MWEPLNEDDGRRHRHHRRRDREVAGAAWFLGLLALIFLAWAVSTTVIAASRVDPPGTFQCGAATGQDGDLCVDDIIVGGGTAGLAAARRLTDDPTRRVLVLEAGPDYGNTEATNRVGDLFGTVGGLVYQTPYKYHNIYMGAAEPGLLNTNPNHINGRLLGGSSQINFLLQMRGTQDMLDAFDADVGSPGTFTGAAMYQTFEDLEYLGPNQYTNLDTRGNGGTAAQTWKIWPLPQGTNDGSDSWQLTSLFSNSLGLTTYTTESYNQPGNNIGVFPYIEVLADFNSSVSDPWRWSSRRAFMNAAVMDQTTHKGVAPRQLDVLLNSTVTRLLTQGTTVVGVEFRDSAGRLRKAFVTHEVILSAYLNSAAILQRSGIGPAAVLASAGITPVLINENVGQNLQVQGILQLPSFWANMTGTGIGVGQTPSITTSMTIDTTGVPTPSNRAFLNFAFGFYGVPQVAVLAIAQNFPVSKGYIKVNSPDPFMSPQIYTGLLSNSSDVISYREDLRALIQDITAYDPSFLPLTLDNATLYDNTAMDAFIRANMEVQYHYYDMTKMGTSAATSVVDARFRVHGMTGLRVCDNGVIPLTDGNPSLPVSAIGDICGRLILEDAGSGYARKPNRAPAAAKKKEVRASAPVTKRAPSLAPRALPSSPEICAAIETYITWLRTNRGDDSQRLIDAIINGPVYTAHNCASA